MPKPKILAAVFLFYIGISLIVTFPVVLHINSFVLGAPHSDIHTHLWDFYWVKTALLENHTFPLSTNLINFPEGGKLVPPSLLNAVLSIPLQTFFGVQASFNIIVILNLALGAFGAFCLVCYFLKDIKPSFVAGAIYGFSPFILSFGVASGGAEIISIAWLPLFFLFFIRTLTEGRLKNPAIASVFFLFLLISCFYYAFISGFFILLFGIYFFIFAKAKKSNLFFCGIEDNKFKAVDKQLLARLAILIFAIFILSFLFVLIVYNSLKGQNSIIPEEATKLRMEGKFLGSFYPKLSPASNHMVYLSDYFNFGKDRLSVSHAVIDLFQSPYCGYSVIFLSLLAFFSLKRKFIYFWLTALILFVILSMGPYLAVSRSCFLENPVSPTYQLIFFFIPVFKAAFLSNRFVVLVMLCLSVLAAIGCKIIVDRLQRPYDYFFTAAVSGLILFEFLFISPIQFPIPETELKLPVFYQKLAKEEGRFGILELPFFISGTNMFPRERFSYQIFHHKPISDIVAGSLPRYIARNPFTKKLVLLERPEPTYYNYSDDGVEKDIYKGFEQLVKDNFRYCIVDKKYYGPAEWEEVKAVLKGFMGEPDVYSDGFEVFRIK